MYKTGIVLMAFLAVAGAIGCSKKNHPASSATVNTTEPAAAKPVKKPAVKTAIPKVITVNDSAAKRSVDGRYYYDLEGHRYWRNNRDGKYYLFHKSMFDNPDFKAPGG
jgi:hypothetical protein